MYVLFVALVRSIPNVFDFISFVKHIGLLNLQIIICVFLSRVNIKLYLYHTCMSKKTYMHIYICIFLDKFENLNIGNSYGLIVVSI